MINEPGEEVSYSGLARFVAPKSIDHAVFDDPANSFDILPVVTQKKMAGRCPHDHNERAGRGHATGRNGGMGVDVSDADRGAGKKAGFFG